MELRQAAQQALDACTDAISGWQSLAPLAVRRAAEEALQDLRDALAEPVQERDALLEALKDIDKEFRAHGRQHWPEAVKARAAIKAAEENT